VASELVWLQQLVKHFRVQLRESVLLC